MSIKMCSNKKINADKNGKIIRSKWNQRVRGWWVLIALDLLVLFVFHMLKVLHSKHL